MFAIPGAVSFEIYDFKHWLTSLIPPRCGLGMTV